VDHREHDPRLWPRRVEVCVGSYRVQVPLDSQSHRGTARLVEASVGVMETKL